LIAGCVLFSVIATSISALAISQGDNMSFAGPSLASG